jgi:hypothetical protein
MDRIGWDRTTDYSVQYLPVLMHLKYVVEGHGYGNDLLSF